MGHRMKKQNFLRPLWDVRPKFRPVGICDFFTYLQAPKNLGPQFSRSLGLQSSESRDFITSVSQQFVLSSEQIWTQALRSYTDKKEKKIFPIHEEIQRDQVQSYVWLTASSYMVKYLRISSYIGKPFHINDFAPDPIWISLYSISGKFCFLFYVYITALR